jgi:tetratricopeptide (TPR) repeat protein
MLSARNKHDKRAAKKPALHDSMTLELEQARAAWLEGKYEGALGMYLRALQRDPRNVRAYLILAQAYAERFQFPDAHAILKSLCQVAPRDTQLHELAGDLYTRIRAPEQALACLEKAAALPGVSVRALLDLAAACERANRLEQALSVLDRIVATGEALREADLVRARVERRMKDDTAAEASLRRIIQALPEDHHLVCQAYGELALMRDAHGDYDGAFSAIEVCKRSQLARGDEHWRDSERGLHRLLRTFESVTQADFDKWHAAGANFEPQRVALLTGFPRSGTTLLEQVLDSHPDVVASEETNYYPQCVLPEISRGFLPGVSLDRMLNPMTETQIKDHRRRFLEGMQNFLGEPLRRRLHVDKNPALMLLVPAQLRIFPELRLLIALRDPRDVVLSAYLRYLPLNVMSVQFLTLERTARRYAADMQAWLRLREMVRAPFCELRYEDTVRDLPTQARRALETLGVRWDDRILSYREQLTDKIVASPSYEAVKQPIYSRALGRFRHYEKHLAPVLSTLEPFLKAFGYS